MIRSGSSIINVAKACKAIGAKDVYVVCVHGVFVSNAIDNLQNREIIKQIYCTNTHSLTNTISSDFIKVKI